MSYTYWYWVNSNQRTLEQILRGEVGEKESSLVKGRRVANIEWKLYEASQTTEIVEVEEE